MAYSIWQIIRSSLIPAFLIVLPTFLLSYRTSSQQALPVSTQPVAFGKYQCGEKVRGSYRNAMLECKSRDGKLSFTRPFWADVLQVSPDQKYMVGLSNRGSSYAFFVMDEEGKVLSQGEHSWADSKLKYCRYSISDTRVWFSEKEPDVRFIFRKGKLQDVHVRSCHGYRRSLALLAPFKT